MNTSQGDKNDREYYTPMFVDRSGNKFTFLYEDFLCKDHITAAAKAVEKVLEVVLLGCKFDSVMTVPRSGEVPHVQCVIQNSFGQEYTIALISGPEFEKHYDPEKAAKTDIEEDRVRKAKEQVERLDQRVYEHEVNVTTQALRDLEDGIKNRHLN